MNKRVSLAIIALFVLGVFLTGCAGSADEVILSSYFQMVRWCEREFGIEPTVVSSEKGKNEVTYVMEDTEKKFTYSAKSYATSRGMDGSTFWWHEEKYSDFGDKYRECFINTYGEQIKEIEAKYDVTISFEPYFYLARIEGNLSENVVNAATDLLVYVSEFDTRLFWKDKSVILYANDEYVGYASETDVFVDAETEYNQWLLECAANEMHVNVKRLDYIMTEVLSVDDIVGYDPDKLAHILGSDNDTKKESKVVHFNYNGEHHWICDLVVYDEETGALVHLGNHLVK